MAAYGLYLCLTGFPEIGPLVAGGLVLAAAIYLWPRARRNRRPTLTQTEAPVLFSLLDAITERQGGARIDGVHVTADFNAYAALYAPRTQVIGIGAPLWLALDADQRLALLAHECAHFANNDPARSELTGQAMVTIDRWCSLFSPPELYDHATQTSYVVDDRGLTGQIVGALFGGATRSLSFVFERLIFVESQRAEYFADVMAAKIAGSHAMAAALKRTMLAPLAGTALKRTRYTGANEVPVFANMAKAVRNATPEEAEPILRTAMEQLLTVDQTHPPTRFRVEVVNAVVTQGASIDASEIDWTALNAELAPFFVREEKSLLAKIIIQ